jgi:hypothetical protein
LISREMEDDLLESLSAVILELSDAVKTEVPATAAYYSRLLASLSKLKRMVTEGRLQKIPPEKATELKNLLVSLERSIREELQRSELSAIDGKLIGLSNVMSFPPSDDE